jgi:type IV secretion system protein VirD4
MYDPIIARLHRSIDGRRGKHLVAAQRRARLAARAPATIAFEQPVAPPDEEVRQTKRRLGMPT